MRVEIDLDAAAEAGVIGEDQAIALRNFQAEMDGATQATSEKFQLFGGYADLVIAIGAAMVSLAVGGFMVVMYQGHQFGWDALSIVAPFLAVGVPLGIFLTSQRINFRASPACAMVMTSAFGFYSFVSVMALFGIIFQVVQVDAQDLSKTFIAVLVLPHLVLCWIHWKTFRFPPIPAMVITGYMVLLFQEVDSAAYLAAISLAVSLGTLAAAAWWDLTDIRRETERSQVAFWLHCCAGILLSRTLFALLTGESVVDGDLVFTGLSLSDAPYVMAMIFVAAIISLLLDRRSLLVGCLIPTVTIFEELASGDWGQSVGLLLAGTALIFFSLMWVRLRTHLLNTIPQKWAAQLPRTSLISKGQRPTRRDKELWHLKLSSDR